MLLATYWARAGPRTWPPPLGTGHCPTKLLDKLVTVHGGRVGEGITEKHDKPLAKVKALGEESISGILRNAKKK